MSVDESTSTGATGRDSDADRGQTSLDFGIAMGVFLLSVGFVFLFVPSMVAPFSQGQEDPIVADRIASQLAQNTIGEPGTPARLNESCMSAFFENVTDPVCPFDAAPVTDQLGLSSSHSVNVTIRRNVSGGPQPDILCHVGDDVMACSTGGDKMIRGSSVPKTSSTSVVAARRTVYIDGWDVMLEVKVW